MKCQPKRAKLTKGYVDKVRPGPKEEFHWDTEIKGFGLKVTPGGKLTFIVQGRIGSAREARLSIGSYGVFTVDQARDVAREHLRSMRMGTDPREVKKQDEAMKVTLRQVADAYFYERPGMLKASTLAEKDRHVEQVFAAFKDKPITSITESDCRKRYNEMATGGLRGKGPAPGQAQMSLVTLSTLINFAQRRYRRLDGTPIITHNPVAALKADWPGFKPRTRDIDEKKVGVVWNLLREASAIARDADARAGVDLVRFLLVTGARRTEGAALTWDRINLDEGWFHLPNPKNDNPVWIPLSSQAVELLKARRPADDDKDTTPYVFPSRSERGHVMDTRAPLEKIRKRIDQPISAHDLRRTYVSVGVATLDIDLYKMELLTNHIPQGITAKHYLRTQRLQYLQPVTQRISDWIEQEAAKASGANVLPLHAGAA